MGKRNPKKVAKKGPLKNISKKTKSKSKLGPGKKYCKNCKQIIAIHKKICSSCGHVHQMRKKKQDIMKNLNKITPILIKSIIQNNDFNQFKGWNQSIQFQIGLVSLKQFEINFNRAQNNNNKLKPDTKNIQRRKSAQNQKQQIKNEKNPKFQQTNHELFYYMSFQKPITLLSNSKKYLIFIESLNKQSLDIQEKQQITISAYDLHNFNLVGATYKGSSYLYFTEMNSESILQNLNFSKVLINRHITKIKSFRNIVALLTGQSTLLLFTLPKNLQTHKYEANQYQLIDKLQIIQPSPDRITAFQFLRSTITDQNKQKSLLLVVGTLFGRISVYKILNNGYKIIRFIPNAHNQMVTTISQCPLNTKDQVVFSSGCYDGTVSFWDIYERNPIFSYQCSNRKIWSMFWDPGAKFLLINRDQSTDNCIIICFYSINKIQTSIHLANNIETRTVKTQKIRTITNHDFYSKSIPLLDPVKGNFKMLFLQQLRSNSLKKKKPKKQQHLDKFYKINLIQSNKEKKHLQVNIQEIVNSQEEAEQSKQIQQSILNKKFPSFSDTCIHQSNGKQYVFISSYKGCVLVYKNQPK